MNKSNKNNELNYLHGNFRETCSLVHTKATSTTDKAEVRERESERERERDGDGGGNRGRGHSGRTEQPSKRPPRFRSGHTLNMHARAEARKHFRENDVIDSHH